MSSSGHVLNRASSQLDKLQASRTCWTHRLDGEQDRVTRNSDGRERQVKKIIGAAAGILVAAAALAPATPAVGAASWDWPKTVTASWDWPK